MTEKLVRDRVPSTMEAEGLNPDYRVAQPHELPVFLGQKVVEEAQELDQAITHGDKSQIREELADLREVIQRIETEFKIAETDVAKLQRQKRIIKGGFRKGFILKEKVARKIKKSSKS